MAEESLDFEEDIKANAVIQEARQRAPAVLQPSNSELEHGLELHRQSRVDELAPVHRGPGDARSLGRGHPEDHRRQSLARTARQRA